MLKEEGWEEVAEYLKAGTVSVDLVLTLSTAEAGRFLHTAPSTLRDTSVSAFIYPFTAPRLPARAMPPAR
jgi:hypothetical protein